MNVDFNLLDFIFAFLLGIISTASPCVLPVIPLIFAGARGEAKNAVLLLSGLASSMAVIGLLSASISAVSQAIPIMRIAAYIFMFLFAAFLISERLEEKLTLAVSSSASGVISRISATNSSFLFGFFLAFVWMPCITPMLGIAISIASLSNPVSSVLVMLFFSLGMMVSISAFLRYGMRYKQIEGIRKFAGYLVLLYLAYFIYTSFTPA